MSAKLSRRPPTSPPVVLTIAGFDPSSGAGVTADLKTFAAHRLYGVSAITALTVQSTQGVRRTEPVGAEILGETLACLADDVEIAGVKIGMLATATNVAAVARFLSGSEISRERIVLDPVIRSSSGRELLDEEGVAVLRDHLLGLAGWVTPNREELAVLIGKPIAGEAEVSQAASQLQARWGGLNIIATGGDADQPNDFILAASGSEHWFAGEHIETSATHGTGCAFSSALLAALVGGKKDVEAVGSAKNYVRQAMLAAYPIGKGRGPLHHLYEFDES
ncbi:hydroxymethylpyrimidine/phosphomethylpyrimidine kinase [Silvibacterium bohemicum]|uniref:hydroxymethylpyrimidine kinase n=1 Tax=Silvibacterium bohemicum TaxID=1577686 RepID=A0A841JUM0_9BACT|nr:bifunctional hydroxymethylpyrimidine kinase/phosphomethylpyrimidine kinase [Silvibacterium bohemicum]MBB6145092.1 hydroxymethylpyrimidine/phosphomethylpyrimidine kinase [Silvibacterium bohemicum]